MPMNHAYVLNRLRSALPAVLEWIDRTLRDYRDHAVPVGSLDFPGLRRAFPPEVLDMAKSVSVAGKVPFPPLNRMGLSEFSPMEGMPIAGITYRDTFFVGRHYETERLYFHETVHVIQWDRLGPADFLLAYGVGFLQCGYRDSPLERMAYSLEEKFVNGTLPADVAEVIRQETDAIWREAGWGIQDAG